MSKKLRSQAEFVGHLAQPKDNQDAMNLDYARGVCRDLAAENTALEAEVEKLREFVAAVEPYIDMLEYCSGGMIREFGADHVEVVSAAYREACVALSEEQSE